MNPLRNNCKSEKILREPEKPLIFVWEPIEDFNLEPRFLEILPAILQSSHLFDERHKLDYLNVFHNDRDLDFSLFIRDLEIWTS
jgi:hypothetical protein